MIRRILILLIKVLISASLAVFILSRIGISRLRQSIGEADLFFILVAVLVFTLSNVLGALQWNLLLRARGIRFSIWRAMSFYFIGLFMNNFLVGYVGGDAFRAYDASRASGNTSGAISAVFLDRLIGFTVLTSIALFVCIFWSNLAASRATMVSVAILLSGWLAALFFFFIKRFAKKFLWLFNILLPSVFHHKIKQIYHNVNAYRHNKSVLVHVLGLSLVIQFFRILVHYFAALAVGIRIDLMYFMIFIPVVAWAASLPISIGGIGVREQTGVLLFSRVSVAEPGVVAMEFLAYLVGVIAAIPGGLIFILRRERTSVHDVRKLEAEPAG